MPWVDGDYLTPTNLNSKGASASSSTGFSTNTVRPESGNTVGIRDVDNLSLFNSSGSTYFSFSPHGNTNYVNGDASAGGQMRLYSQIMPYQSDLVLLAPRSTVTAVADYDVHIGIESQASGKGNGVFFIDTDIKVADFVSGSPRGHGLRVVQTDNSPFIEFPISGGIGTLHGRIQGFNSASSHFIVAPGANNGQFIVQNPGFGATVFSVDTVGNVLANTAFQTASGLANRPGYQFASEKSLGFWRSATSSVALSYGTLDLRSGAVSLRTTASAGSSSALTNGEFCLVNVSTTSAQLAWRSGNTTYLFNAVVASP